MIFIVVTRIALDYLFCGLCIFLVSI